MVLGATKEPRANLHQLVANQSLAVERQHLYEQKKRSHQPKKMREIQMDDILKGVK